MIQEAQGYATEIVNRAQGDAERFLSVLKEYNNAKDITKKRIYIEKMQSILKKAGVKFIIDEKEKGLLPLLNLTGKENR